LENLRVETERSKQGGTPKLDVYWTQVFEAQSRIMADARKLSRDRTLTEKERLEYREFILGLAKETMAAYRAATTANP